MITQRKLKAIIHYNPLTGVFKNLVDRSNNSKKGQVIGSKHNGGYLTIRIEGQAYLAHRLATLYTDGYLPEGQVDHEDQVKHHNWYSNLRPDTSPMCQSRNTKLRSDNTSGVRGVHWYKARSKHHVQITVQNKTAHIGYFESFTEAVCHRYAAEQCLNWAGCDTTSPAYLHLKEKGIIK